MPEPVSSNQPTTTSSTNTAAIIGFILAIVAPPIGLIVSIIGLVQAKKRHSGKGLAIAGVIISIVELLITALIIVIIVIAAVNSSSKLVNYHNNEIGYTVEYPSKWTIDTQTDGTTKSTLFKDKLKDTGLVKGQVEVVYVPPPANGYNGDVLNAIRDSFKTTYKNLAINSESRQQFKGLDSLTFLATYDGETGKLKAKFTLILKKDNSVYAIVTQAPEQNWDGLQEEFYTIHNTFEP